MNESKKTLITGFSCGIMEILLTMPLDYIKNLKQNKNDKNILSIIKKIYKNKGIIGFYYGSTPMIIQTLAKTSLRFTLYNYLKNNLNTKNNILHSSMITGFCEGLFLIAPTDRIKLYNQFHKNDSLYNSIKNIKNKYGFSSFFKGSSFSIIKNTIGISTRFITYEYLKKNNTPILLNGFLSGIVSSIISHPFDTIKTNIQINNKKEPIYKEITNIYNKGGLLGFMKGFTPRVIRVGMAQMIIFTTYDILYSKL